MFCEGLEGGEQGAGAMGQAHGDGHFMGLWSGRRGFGGGTEQEKAGEIFGIVLDASEENDATVMFGGAAASDGGGAFVTAREGFADAAGGVFGGDALEVRMRYEETLALS